MLNQICIKSNFTDNSPICPSPEYEIELSEGAPVGTYVISVEASDPDLSKQTSSYMIIIITNHNKKINNGKILFLFCHFTLRIRYLPSLPFYISTHFLTKYKNSLLPPKSVYSSF